MKRGRKTSVPATPDDVKRMRGGKPVKSARKPKSAKQMKAAAMRVEGKKLDEIAAECGYANRGTARRAINSVLNYEQFEDIKRLRVQAEERLNDIRRRALKIAGVRDAEDPESLQAPKLPEAVRDGQRGATADELKAWRDECSARGFDPWGDPHTYAEPAQIVSALRVALLVEQRRASMFGFNAPKFVVPTESKFVSKTDYEGIAARCVKHGIPIPPGVEEFLAKRRMAVERGEADSVAGGSARTQPPAG